MFDPSLSLTEGLPRADGLRSFVQSTVFEAMFEITGGCRSIRGNKKNNKFKGFLNIGQRI